MGMLSELENLRQLLANPPREKGSPKLAEYGFDRAASFDSSIRNSMERIRQEAFALAGRCPSRADRERLLKLLNLVSGDFSSRLDELEGLARSLDKDRAGRLRLQPAAKVPDSIKPAVAADIREMEKAFNSGCYRAATILCGRILEVALHKKHYDVTNNDLLEKSPGIGLGKLIARLSEKDVKLDPGLMQQIHLINQVRVHSVHVKKQAFSPTRQQAYAMILYTMDILEKLF